MTQATIQPARRLHGHIRVPGDKSISHRALMFGSLADGISQIDGFLPSGDCQSTLACFRALGVQIKAHSAATLSVHGCGLR